jgi:hypothetical protein
VSALARSWLGFQRRWSVSGSSGLFLSEIAPWALPVVIVGQDHSDDAAASCVSHGDASAGPAQAIAIVAETVPLWLHALWAIQSGGGGIVSLALSVQAPLSAFASEAPASAWARGEKQGTRCGSMNLAGATGAFLGAINEGASALYRPLDPPWLVDVGQAAHVIRGTNGTLTCAFFYSEAA